MGSCTSAGKGPGAGKGPRDTRLRAMVIDDYTARNGSTNGIESLRINATVDGGGSFKTTFRALGASTRGNLRINAARSGFSSDGKTYSAVISNRQMTDATRDLVKKLKNKK